MFTGIVTAMATVRRVRRTAHGLEVVVEHPYRRRIAIGVTTPKKTMESMIFETTMLNKSESPNHRYPSGLYTCGTIMFTTCNAMATNR